MEEKESKASNWTSFFFVTGVCLLLFSALMKLLDGVPLRFFVITGLAATGLGVLCFLNEWISKRFLSPKKSNISPQQQEAA